MNWKNMIVNVLLFQKFDELQLDCSVSLLNDSKITFFSIFQVLINVIKF